MAVLLRRTERFSAATALLRAAEENNDAKLQKTLLENIARLGSTTEGYYDEDLTPAFKTALKTADSNPELKSAINCGFEQVQNPRQPVCKKYRQEDW